VTELYQLLTSRAACSKWRGILNQNIVSIERLASPTAVEKIQESKSMSSGRQLISLKKLVQTFVRYVPGKLSNMAS